MKQFTSIHDVPDLEQLLTLADRFRQDPHAMPSLGAGKTLGLLFLNPSLRTRMSTQIAAARLGLQVVVCDADKDAWALELRDGAVMDGAGVEHIKDAAHVLGRYFDLIGMRSFPSLKDRAEDYSETVMERFRQAAGKPYISLESATRHPLQSLADCLTIRMHQARPRPRVVLTWAPHIKPLPQAVANSFAEWVLRTDAELVITHPPGYELDPRFTAGAAVTHDQGAALDGADFVYVKNWSPLEPYGTVQCRDRSWMLTGEHLARTNAAKVMHCLPVRRNLELSDEVIDGPNSIVYDQAANRIPAAQAVLASILLNGV